MAEKLSILAGIVLDQKDTAKITKQFNDLIGGIKDFELKIDSKGAEGDMKRLADGINKTGELAGKLLKTNEKIGITGIKTTTQQLKLANDYTAKMTQSFTAEGELRDHSLEMTYDAVAAEEKYNAQIKEHLKWTEKEKVIAEDYARTLLKQGDTLDNFVVKGSHLTQEGDQRLSVEKAITDALGRQQKITEDIILTSKKGVTSVASSRVTGQTGGTNYAAQAKQNEQAMAKEATKVATLTKNIEALQNSMAILGKRAASTSETLDKKFVKTSHHGQVKNLNTEIQSVTSEILQFDTSLNRNSKQLQEQYNAMVKSAQGATRLKTDLDETGKQIKATGKYALNMGEMVKNAFKGFSVWMGVTTIFYQGIAAIKSGVVAVMELDKSLVNFNKVADVTEGQLQNITDRAFDMGKGLAQTGTAVIDATTDFVQAGYNIEDSLTMAKNAMVLMNVGEVELADSTDVLISATENYNLTAEESIAVADKLNEVSNTTSAEVGNLADGLQRTAGQLAQTGTTLDENLGLLAAGFTTLRNMEKVSSGLITIASRLNRVDSETGELNAEFPKLEKTFNQIGMTLLDSNGELKSTYDILQELSKVYPKLNSLQQANLNFLVSGSRQGNVLTAILNEFNIAEQAVTDSLNSQNSAMTENEARIDSIDGKLRTLQSSWQQMWSNAINKELIKSLLDIATALISLVDNVGLLGAALSITLGIMVAMGKVAVFNTMLGGIKFIITIMPAFISAMQYGFSATNSLTIALGGATIAANLFWGAVTMGIGLIVSGLITAFMKSQTEAKNLQEALKNVKEEMYDFGGYVNDFSKSLDDFKLKSTTENLDLMGKSLEELKAKFKAMSEEVDFQSAKDKIESFEKSIQKLKDEAKNAYAPTFNYTANENQIKSYEASIEQLEVKYADLFAAEKDVSQSAFEYSMAVKDLNTRTLYGIKTNEDAVATVEELAKAYEDANTAIDDFKSAMSNIEGIYDAVNAGEKLSITQLLELIQTYPEYAGQIMDANSNKEKGLTLAEALFEAEKTRAIQAIEINKQILLGEQNILLAKKENALSALKQAEAAYEGGMIEIETLNAMKSAYSAVNQAVGSSVFASLTKSQTLIAGYSYEDFAKDATANDSKTKKDSGTEKEIASLEAYFYKLQEIAKLQANIEKVKSKSEIDGVDRKQEVVGLLTNEQNLLKGLNNARRADLAILNKKLALDSTNVELIQEIADLESDIRDTSSEWFGLESEKVGLLQTQKDLMAEIAEKSKSDYIDALKAQAEAYQTQLDVVNSLVESTEELIKSEQEANKEWINDQKEKLNLLQEEEDYKKTLAEQSKSVADLENALNLASRDKSQAGLAKTATLQEQLSEAQTTLSETQSDKQIEEQQSMYDTEIELIDDYLSQSGKITSDAMDRINADMKSGTSSLMSKLIDWNAKYGTSIQSDITDMWTSAKTAMADYNNEVASSQVGLASASDSATKRAGELESGGTMTVSDIKKAMMANSAAWKATTDTDLRNSYANQNQSWANTLSSMGTSITRGKDGSWYYANGTKFYDQGGVASGIGYMAKNTLSPERVLSPEQTISFNKLVDMMPSLLSMVGGRITPISSGTSSNNINLTMPIMIEGNATSDTVSALKAQTKIIADTVLNQINSSFSTNGQYKLRTS